MDLSTSASMRASAGSQSTDQIMIPRNEARFQAKMQSFIGLKHEHHRDEVTVAVAAQGVREERQSSSPDNRVRGRVDCAGSGVP